MGRLKIVSAYDAKYAPIGDISARSIRNYAAQTGHDFKIFDLPDTGRPPAWGKIPVIRSALSESDHEFVMWVDADACFVRSDRDIANEMKPGMDLYLVFHRIAVHSFFPGVHAAIDRPNSGVMVLRKSEWSFRFLDKIWGMTQYLNHGWWENAAIIDLLGLRAEFSGDFAKNVPDPEWCGKTQPLPLPWNACPTAGLYHCSEVFDPIIVHAAAMTAEERIGVLSRWCLPDDLPDEGHPRATRRLPEPIAKQNLAMGA